MREVATGVWHWRAAHPEWKPGRKWDRTVSSYAVDTGEGFLLFDPLDVPADLRERASAVVLTCPWHRRHAPQLGLPIHVPPPDPPDPDPVRGEVFRGGDTLPLGVRAFEGFEPNDVGLAGDEQAAARPVAAGHAGHAGGAGNWPALRQEFDDEVTVAPEYDPRFLRRVAGPDYQSFWVCTYGGNINTVDHHQLRTVARALALKAERPRERLGLSECAQNLVLAKARLPRGWRFSIHPRTSLLQQPRIGSFA